MKLETLKQKMDAAHYIYDDTLATVLTVALQLGRPLLIEGAAGVGKTEVAKVMASALDRELVRLQCYEGLDESKALYEWNYQKQLLSIQVHMASQDREELTRSLFSDEYLLERPLLHSIRSEKPVPEKHVRVFRKRRTCFRENTYMFFPRSDSPIYSITCQHIMFKISYCCFLSHYYFMD